jgi:predicted enzyme related to lactoylglutathione lyase
MSRSGWLENIGARRSVVSEARHVRNRNAWKDDDMKITRQIIAFDAADLAAESTFWAGLLGGTVDAEDDWHMVSVNGEPRLGFQLAPNHVPPVWPDGTPQQIHLDLYVEDVKAAHEEAVALGARLLKPADDIDAAEGFQVYADPAGHPFCLCW